MIRVLVAVGSDFLSELARSCLATGIVSRISKSSLTSTSWENSPTAEANLLKSSLLWVAMGGSYWARIRLGNPICSKTPLAFTHPSRMNRSSPPSLLCSHEPQCERSHSKASLRKPKERRCSWLNDARHGVFFLHDSLCSSLAAKVTMKRSVSKSVLVIAPVGHTPMHPLHWVHRSLLRLIRFDLLISRAS